MDSEKPLLSDYAADESHEIEPDQRYTQRPTLTQRFQNQRWLSTLICVSATSLLGNLWAVKNEFQRQSVGLNPSFFAGVPYDTHIEYQSQTEYWGRNQSLSDELWDNLSTDALEITLTDEYAISHGIPLSAFRFPWDPSRGVYFLKAFHDLHCLKVIRRAFVDIERGNPSTIEPHHVNHCLDAIRQDISCNADDTPMPTVQLSTNTVGDGQVRLCRSLDSLVAWAQCPDQTACFKHFTDYYPLKNKLEMYAFCPEDSPYFAKSQAYFKKWGHKDGSERATSEDTIAQLG